MKGVRLQGKNLGKFIYLQLKEELFNYTIVSEKKIELRSVYSIKI
jgi:hypothetical protein